MSNTAKSLLGTGLAYALAGIDLWTDPPRKLILRLHPNGTRPRNFRQPQEIAERWPDIPPRTRTDRPSKLRFIDLQWREAISGTWHDASLVIDIDRRRLDWAFTTSHLLGKEHRGAAAMGVFLLTLPVTVPIGMPLLAIAAGRGYLERSNGMSRHASALLAALAGQLDGHTEALLRETLRNEWAHERKLARRPTFDEACELLSTLPLHETVVRIDGVAHGRDLCWVDAEGDVVARNSDRVERIAVLGACFFGQEAAALTRCYASRTYAEETA